ncbi:hypothetical protein [Aureimonas sp. ME7]|uniref:hypothetical protein n=1 Tax=Aureimonas sp. ME7 TaxID=2744252 RepID=UPI0015F9E05F|nr:hypothetical protein [Aureimonas sp. ME7]
MNEVIGHLMTALDVAKTTPGQTMLVKLIEAVLLHAGFELAQSAFPDGALPVDDE